MSHIERKLEVAWAGSFYDDPAALVWTDLSNLWTDDRTLKAKLGRDSDLAAIPQAGLCRFRLIAVDGAGVATGALTPGNVSSPYYPHVVSGVPVRVSAKDAAGTWWPVFYGLTEAFNPSMVGNVPDWTVVDVQCVSAWASLTQAGARRTYADRVVGDLAPAKGEVWAAGLRDYGYPNVLYVAGGVIYGGGSYTGTLAWPDAFELGSDFQRFGFTWLTLDNTGGKTWATPGAACPAVETGGSDSSGANAAKTALNGGFAGDRPGGQFVVRSDGTMGVSAFVAGSASQSNWSRAQVLVGRPPTQLAPASVSAPVNTSGWTASAGTVTLVAASSLAHLPRTAAYDPATKATAAAVIDGPANAITWAGTAGATLTSAVFPVTAGKFYGPLFVTTGSAGAAVEWLDAASAVLSTTGLAPVTTGGTSLFGQGAAGIVAPTSAVSARILLTGSGTSTVTVGCVGFYEAQALGAVTITPARHWPIGADAAIWAWVQWPDLLTSGMTSGTAGQIRWLHVAIDVTAWDDAALHMIGWNGYPGEASKPVVWADGVRVTTGWLVSYPGANVGNDVAHTTAYNGSGMGGGFGTVYLSSPATRMNTTNPSALIVPAALLGAAQYEVTPDDVSIERAFARFGGAKTLGATYATDTGAQMTRALDQLGWPDALRTIATGASTAAPSWADLAGLGDYSALIGDLTKIEYGWVDIDPSGHLVWKPRAWYGVTTATAVAHYTWRAPAAGQTAYSPPLDVRWDDKDTLNHVVVGNGQDTMTRSRHDVAGQRRGLRKDTFIAGWTTQAAIDAVADILAVVHAPGPRIESLTLRAHGPDDPMLAHILARRTGDVVLVDLPQLPAADLSVPMLVTSIEHSSDGIVWSTRLGLGVCPIPAEFAVVVDGGTMAEVPDLTVDGGTLSGTPDLILDAGTL